MKIVTVNMLIKISDCFNYVPEIMINLMIIRNIMKSMIIFYGYPSLVTISLINF